MPNPFRLLGKLKNILLSLASANLKRFFVSAVIGVALFAAIVGAGAFYLAQNAGGVSQAAVAVVVAVASLITGLLWAAVATAHGFLQTVVESTGVGPLISKLVFKQALGVSDKRPQGSSEVAAELDAADDRQAKQAVETRLASVFSSAKLEEWLPARGRWIAKKLIGSVGWAVTTAVLGRLPAGPVNLLDLRSHLADGLNDAAVGIFTTRLVVAATLATGALAFLCLAAAVLAAL
ncbi:hypothetical protein Pla175_47860 [Pirellulimonas nuda]|uniref:Uncharacterized protein n=1 Tax=Pirellulimonas nuda TaxID=2528009 RepID=A0A518DIR6_9BACT|nr:hypothetical protein [Pirellulimonas nuda]QDU91364.1 hypothetical protein Pla175_47860 [Pirellulimonas nuda]